MLNLELAPYIKVRLIHVPVLCSVYKGDALEHDSQIIYR